MLLPVLRSKEETGSRGEAHEAEKSSGRIYKDVGSMSIEVYHVPSGIPL